MVKQLCLTLDQETRLIFSLDVHISSTKIPISPTFFYANCSFWQNPTIWGCFQATKNVNSTLVHLLITRRLMFPNIPTDHFYSSPRSAWFLVTVINRSDCEARSMVHHLSGCCSSIILKSIIYGVLNCNKVRMINSMNAPFKHDIGPVWIYYH